MMKPGIYIHLPFCRVHCSYCDFPLTTRRSLESRYYDALQTEISLVPASQNADTLYFGGGTPSLCPPEELARIRDRFQLDEKAEITLEANPEDITERSVLSWKELGINRLSIGVQSLDDRVLKTMLRQHTAADTMQAFSIARREFENVNVDLIIGAPHQMSAGLLNDVRQLIDRHPDHFSIYLLELHENTALFRRVRKGLARPMEDDEQLDCFTASVRLLQDAGYQHYEVSNFALPQKESRHNLKYWTGASYYAYGAGACSYYDSRRVRNIPAVSNYIDSTEKGERPVESSILEDGETVMRNALIFGLRKTAGVNVSEFQQSYDVHPLTLFREPPEHLIKEGYLEIADGHIRLTFAGLLVSNEILENIL